MIPLAKEFSVRGRSGYYYEVVKREGDVVLVKMYKDEKINEEKLNGYEVFIVQKYPDRPRPDGKGIILAKELPPGDYFWGSKGFSYGGVGMKDGSCLVRAEKKFNELVEAAQLKAALAVGLEEEIKEAIEPFIGKKNNDSNRKKIAKVTSKVIGKISDAQAIQPLLLPKRKKK